MDGSPASSTPTVTREASQKETPTQLRDSSLLQSDESAIVEVTTLLPLSEIINTDKMAENRGRTSSTDPKAGEKRKEIRLMRGLSSERITCLEERMRGRTDLVMNETPRGADVDEVVTPQSQKSKFKGEKKKGSDKKRTPEVVRDTPRKRP